MKSLLAAKFSLLILSLTSTTALAHSGHLSVESAHGFLHVEHIIALVVFAVIAYAVNVMRNK